MELKVIPLYAGLLGLFYIYLSFKVIGLRRSTKVGVGDGGDSTLGKAIRVHGNFSEYIPISLILIGFLEINQTPLWIIHVLGGVLFFGRVLHHIGLSKSKGVSFGRYYGSLLTFIVLVISSIACVVKTFL